MFLTKKGKIMIKLMKKRVKNEEDLENYYHKKF